MSMPLGCQRGSKGQEEPVEPKFLDPRYDQQVLKEAESKKISNFGILDEIWLF